MGRSIAPLTEVLLVESHLFSGEPARLAILPEWEGHCGSRRLLPPTPDTVCQNVKSQCRQRRLSHAHFSDDSILFRKQRQLPCTPCL